MRVGHEWAQWKIVPALNAGTAYPMRGGAVLMIGDLLSRELEILSPADIYSLAGGPTTQEKTNVPASSRFTEDYDEYDPDHDLHTHDPAAATAAQAKTTDLVRVFWLVIMLAILFHLIGK